MWLVFLLFLSIILLLGIIYSKIELDLQHIRITEKSIEYKLKASFKLFGLFTVIVVHFDEEGIKILKRKIDYKKMKMKNETIKFYKKLIRILKKVKFDKINFVLKIGLIDVFLTNDVIVIISSAFPMVIKNKVKRKKLNYKILPEYNKLNFYLSGTIKFSIKSLELREFIFRILSNRLDIIRIKKWSKGEF